MAVIDCVKPPPVDAMRAAGVTGLCRYLSWTDRDSLGKVIHKAEYDSLRTAGLQVLLNWEFDARDYLGGAMVGGSHAREAANQARALGYPPGCAIVGSADADVSRADWLAPGRPYYSAFSTGLRLAGYIPGIYGPWDVLTWARQDGVADVFWQAGMSTAWSAGRNAALWPGAHLRQRRTGFIGGFEVDFNDVVQANFGQVGAEMALKDEALPAGAPNAAQALSDLWNDWVKGKSGFANADGTHDVHFVNAQLDRLETAIKGLAAPAVALTDADRADIAAKIAALLPPLTAAPTAAQIAEELAARLGNG